MPRRLFLQVIYYTHSTEQITPGLDDRVLEENILRAVFNKKLLERVESHDRSYV
jgi:hypothetical protein